MTDAMPIDMHIIESNDYFRVANAITKIESSEHKDIEKIKILYAEAKRLFKDLHIESAPKIKGIKWNGTQYIHKDMTEDELIKEVQSCIEERYHPDKAQQNLIALAHHYKMLWSQSKMYLPFFEYNLQLMDRIVGNPRIKEVYDDTERSKELLDHLAKAEEENLKLKDQINDFTKKLEFIKIDIRDTLLNEQMYKLMGQIYKDNIKDEKLVRILILTQLNKTVTLRDIFHELRIAVADIKNYIHEYPQYFKMDKDGGISLNFDEVEKKAQQEIEEKLRPINELTQKKESILKQASKILKIFKKK